jgi:hypothetical protein
MSFLRTSVLSSSTTRTICSRSSCLLFRLPATTPSKQKKKNRLYNQSSLCLFCSFCFFLKRYTGENSCVAVREYVKKRFEACNKSKPTERSVYSHVTCATDTKQIEVPGCWLGCVCSPNKNKPKGRLEKRGGRFSVVELAAQRLQHVITDPSAKPENEVMNNVIRERNKHVKRIREQKIAAPKLPSAASGVRRRNLAKPKNCVGRGGLFLYLSFASRRRCCH